MLQPFPVSPVPTNTIRVARAALRNQNSCLQLRDYLGTVFDNEMFAPLFPERGQPAAAPWRLALVTILQFSEGLSDRDAADAVRSRIDWKYLLGLELGDPGFDYSILSRFLVFVLSSIQARSKPDSFPGRFCPSLFSPAPAGRHTETLSRAPIRRTENPDVLPGIWG